MACMFVTVINDCHDFNAAARQCTRLSHLFGVTPSFIGVEAYQELQAAGNLVDVLDAGEAGEGVVLVNVAPRHGNARRWPNGTPFAYFYVGETLVVASIDGLTLSLVKKLHITDAVRIIDLPDTTQRMLTDGDLTAKQREHILGTQFRSFDYLPRVARYLWDYEDKIGESLPVREVPDAPPAIWWVDNFGDCKTTLLAKDLAKLRPQLAPQFRDLQLYQQLKDVPDGAAAFTVGSSGFGTERFIELVIQGAPAHRRFGISAGDPLIAPAAPASE